MTESAIVRCHCGKFNTTVHLRDPIPIEGSLCHCNRCRRVTGAMTFSGVNLSSPPIEEFQQKLTQYATSESITQYFCGSCGSHVGYNVITEDRWAVCPGDVVEIIGPSSGKGILEKYTGHEYAASPIDGGLTRCFPGIPCYVEGPNGPVMQQQSNEQPTGQRQVLTGDGHGQEQIKAGCFCGGVEFSILRPESSPEGGSTKTASEQAKWRTVLCVCRDCSLSTGQPVSAWAKDVPFSKIIWPDGSAHDGQLHGTMRRFQSSPIITRDFCGRCGASIFYHASDRPDVMDIAVGIIQAEEGALARSLLEWRVMPPDFANDAIDQVLVETLERNIERLA